MKSKSSRLILPYSIGIILLAVDFGIKFIANRVLPYQESLSSFLPFLKWYRTHNTGYHFILGNIGNHRVWAISGLVLVLILIVILSRSLVKEAEKRADIHIYSILLALMIGATGNVLEVLFAGRATDFFVFRPFPWPSNLSDQYVNAIIYIMMPITIIKGLIDSRRAKRESGDQPAAPEDSTEEGDR